MSRTCGCRPHAGHVVMPDFMAAMIGGGFRIQTPVRDGEEECAAPIPRSLGECAQASARPRGLEQDSLPDPGLVAMGDRVHLTDPASGKCVLAFITATTSTPQVVHLTVFPAAGGFHPEKFVMFNPEGDAASTWHLRDECPREPLRSNRVQDYVSSSSIPGVVGLIPVPIPTSGLPYDGDNFPEMQRFTGTRENGEPRFLLPNEVTGNWRYPHVYNEAREQWEPVKVGDWVVSGLQGEFLVVAHDVVRSSFLHMPRT